MDEVKNVRQVILNSLEQLNQLSDLQDHSIDRLVCKKDVLGSLHSLNEVSAFFKYSNGLLQTEGRYEIFLVDVDDMKIEKTYPIDNRLYFIKEDRLWLKTEQELKELIPIPYIIFQSILLLYDLEIVQINKKNMTCKYIVKKVVH